MPEDVRIRWRRRAGDGGSDRSRGLGVTTEQMLNPGERIEEGGDLRERHGLLGERQRFLRGGFVNRQVVGEVVQGDQLIRGVGENRPILRDRIVVPLGLFVEASKPQSRNRELRVGRDGGLKRLACARQIAAILAGGGLGVRDPRLGLQRLQRRQQPL